MTLWHEKKCGLPLGDANGVCIDISRWGSGWNGRCLQLIWRSKSKTRWRFLNFVWIVRSIALSNNQNLTLVVFQDFQRAVIHRFPYVIYYRIIDRRIIVIAVVHGKRDPKIWQSRKWWSASLIAMIAADDRISAIGLSIGNCWNTLPELRIGIGKRSSRL